MQSIIVYRNPVEAAFWEMMSNGQLFPIMVGILVFFCVFLTLHTYAVERYTSTFGKYRKHASNLALFASVIVAVYVVYFLWV